MSLASVFVLAVIGLVCCPFPARAAGAVSVRDFGAKGDGTSDDRPAVQRAIDSLDHGGSVCFPAGVYLMDSVVTSRAGDSFNLLITHDGISLQPCLGVPAGRVKLLQGPFGWGSTRHFVFGPIAIFNSQFFMDSPVGQNGYQNVRQNGGYFGLRSSVVAGAGSVSFEDKPVAGKFVKGDWIAIAQSKDQTITPLEINRVIAVDRNAGTVSLEWHQTQSFDTGFAAKVTNLVRSNVAVKGLVIQGTRPIFLNDVYDLRIEDCKIVPDGTYVGPGRATYMFANAVRKMVFRNNVVAAAADAIPAQAGGMELPQNNSIDVLIEHNDFRVAAGAGEFSEHWMVRNNTFQLGAGADTGVTLQGYDVIFEGNTVTASTNMRFLYADNSTAPNPYGWLFSHQKIVRNRFIAAGGDCVVRLYAPDTEFSDNQVVAGNEQHALWVEVGGRPQRNMSAELVRPENLIERNRFDCSVTKVFGCVLISHPSLSGIRFRGNSLLGHDSVYGVWTKSGVPPDLQNNTYTGFKTPLFFQKWK